MADVGWSAGNGCGPVDAAVEVLAWLDPRPGERILDLGCGDGRLARVIKARGAEVTGIDISPEMVATARRNGVDARLGDGHALAFDGAFDAVFSNAALHWMARPNAVISGVRRALRPGGRFVGELGGFGNLAAVRVALLALARRHGIDPGLADPWFFPHEESYARRLAAGGFHVERIVLVPAPTPLPETGLRVWLKSLRGPFFDHIPEGPAREAALDEVITDLTPLRDPNGRWVADYVRLRFAARRG